MSTAKKIRILLIEKNISGAEIARAIGVDRSAVYHTISGKSKSAKLRKAIANALKLPIEELWSEEKLNINQNIIKFSTFGRKNKVEEGGHDDFD
ncbi:helix-turn-helix transcriptional regulator [Candidatus Nomurabacteria bacterium]|nr:helix-turn-helix transcriptional regulator [Candidatus Nomurabacteria bacterium]